MASDITIGIPTYNDDPEVFRRVLATATSASDAPLIVVDMSTNEGVAKVCSDFAQRVRYVAFPESCNVSHSRNKLFSETQTRYLNYLDSDAIPEPGWLDAIVDAFASDVAVVGSRIVPLWSSKPPLLFDTAPAADWLSCFDLGSKRIDVPRIMGTSYAVDRNKFDRPPFDEQLGRSPGWPLAIEEPALCVKAIAQGHRVVYAPASVVGHTLPAERLNWSWMWRRAHTAGRETRIQGGRFEPLPRAPFTFKDRLFQALCAVPFFLGRLRPVKDRPQGTNA